MVKNGFKNIIDVTYNRFFTNVSFIDKDYTSKHCINGQSVAFGYFTSCGGRLNFFQFQYDYTLNWTSRPPTKFEAMPPYGDKDLAQAKSKVHFYKTFYIQG